jgi:hypothetical protein
MSDGECFHDQARDRIGMCSTNASSPEITAAGTVGRLLLGRALASKVLNRECANSLRLFLSGLRNEDDALSHGLDEWVVPVGEAKNRQRTLVCFGHSFDVVRIKGRVLKQSINRHRAPKHNRRPHGKEPNAMYPMFRIPKLTGKLRR